MYSMYSGERRSGGGRVTPMPCKRSRTDRVSRAWTMAALSFFTTSAGAPLGMKMAVQVWASLLWATRRDLIFHRQHHILNFAQVQLFCADAGSSR
jgi:hypothetical protein